jgi:hypothetical protein
MADQLLAPGASPRNLLRRMLLGPYGALVCGRRNERALDRAPGAACPPGEAYAVGTVGRAHRRRCLYRCRIRQRPPRGVDAQLCGDAVRAARKTVPITNTRKFRPEPEPRRIIRSPRREKATACLISCAHRGDLGSQCRSPPGAYRIETGSAIRAWRVVLTSEGGSRVSG